MLTIFLYLALFGGALVLWWIGSKVIDYFSKHKKKYKRSPFKSKVKSINSPLPKANGVIRDEKPKRSYSSFAKGGDKKW